jgi:hypothetical protein
VLRILVGNSEAGAGVLLPGDRRSARRPSYDYYIVAISSVSLLYAVFPMFRALSLTLLLKRDAVMLFYRKCDGRSIAWRENPARGDGHARQ